MKKLYRAERDRKLAGVVGGLAEYVKIDANILRLLVIMLFFVGFVPVAVTYLIAWVILPEESEVKHELPEGSKTART